MTTLYSCDICGAEIEELPGDQVCDVCEGEGWTERTGKRTLRVEEAQLILSSEPSGNDEYARELRVELYEEGDDGTVVNIRFKLEPDGEKRTAFHGGINLTRHETTMLRDFLDAVILAPDAVERTFNELKDQLRQGGT